MTTTRQATWREAKKGQLVQARDLSIWRLEAMGKDDSGHIVVTMAAVDPERTCSCGSRPSEIGGAAHRDGCQEIQVRPPSYDSPVTFVEPLIEAPKLSSPSAAAAELGEKIRVGQERAHAAIARANAEREAQTYELPHGEAAADMVQGDLDAMAQGADEAIPYVEPMPDLTAYDEPELDAAVIAAEATPTVDPSEAAPIQSADEVWPVGPLDDASAGEMMTHLFLFHGDWQKENGKKGKSLLADLHRIHGEKEHGTGQSAGIHHEHRQKGNDAP